MRKIKKIGFIVLAAVLLIISLNACGKEAAKPTVLFDVEFHRGGRDARPENTLYSYQYAIENGANTIECDMQMTKDGQIVLSHNSVLNPEITTDSAGQYVEPDKYYIRDMTLEEVQKYNVGRMDPYHEELTPEQVKEAHENGMKVVPWTVNRVEDMERMYEMGVDGVVTDRPWIIREYLQSKGDAIRPTAKVDLSYHLEPDHFEVEAGQNSNGMDSAY